MISKLQRYFYLILKSRSFRKHLKAIELSTLFDQEWYLENYPDSSPGFFPAVDYLKKWSTHDREPGPNFSNLKYLEAYPDVAATGMNPLLHFELFGKNEGRKNFPSVTIVPDRVPSPPPVSYKALLKPSISEQEFKFDPKTDKPLLHVHETPLALIDDFMVGAEGSERFDGIRKFILLHHLPLDATLVAIQNNKKETVQIANLTKNKTQKNTFGFLKDIAFASSNMLRVSAGHTNENGCPLVLHAFQFKPSGVVVQDFKVLTRFTIQPGALRSETFYLCNPLFPLLLLVTDQSGLLIDSMCLAFPALLRGGIYYPELCASRSNKGYLADLNSYQIELLTHWLQEGKPTIQLDFDVRQALGTEQLLNQYYLEWLALIMQVKVLVTGTDKLSGDVKAYLKNHETDALYPKFQTYFPVKRFCLTGSLIPQLRWLINQHGVRENKNADLAEVLILPKPFGTECYKLRLKSNLFQIMLSSQFEEVVDFSSSKKNIFMPPDKCLFYINSGPYKKNQFHVPQFIKNFPTDFGGKVTYLDVFVRVENEQIDHFKVTICQLSKQQNTNIKIGKVFIFCTKTSNKFSSEAKKFIDNYFPQNEFLFAKEINSDEIFQIVVERSNSECFAMINQGVLLLHQNTFSDGYSFLQSENISFYNCSITNAQKKSAMNMDFSSSSAKLLSQKNGRVELIPHDSVLPACTSLFIPVNMPDLRFFMMKKESIEKIIWHKKNKLNEVGRFHDFFIDNNGISGIVNQKITALVISSQNDANVSYDQSNFFCTLKSVPSLICNRVLL